MLTTIQKSQAAFLTAQFRSSSKLAGCSLQVAILEVVFSCYKGDFENSNRYVADYQVYASSQHPVSQTN